MSNSSQQLLYLIIYCLNEQCMDFRLIYMWWVIEGNENGIVLKPSLVTMSLKLGVLLQSKRCQVLTSSPAFINPLLISQKQKQKIIDIGKWWVQGIRQSNMSISPIIIIRITKHTSGIMFPFSEYFHILLSTSNKVSFHKLHVKEKSPFLGRH